MVCGVWVKGFGLRVGTFSVGTAYSNARRGLRSSPDQLPYRRTRKERYCLPAFPPSFGGFFFRAFRGAASRTALRRRGARRESMSERGHRRCPSEFRFAAPTRGRAVSRSAYRPAAFSVPFLAGQKGDIPTDPTIKISACRQKFVTARSIEPDRRQDASLRSFLRPSGGKQAPAEVGRRAWPMRLAASTNLRLPFFDHPPFQPRSQPCLDLTARFARSAPAGSPPWACS
jgi:hypothetical protein